ncbi:uncharacterized protein DS421_6g185580 [Arachis hypogaea]|nr:uncharacterized protein DS421_6g185580 [Arachis hypogaea]
MKSQNKLITVSVFRAQFHQNGIASQNHVHNLIKNYLEMRKSVAFSQSLKDNASTLQRFNASLLLSQRQSATAVTCEVAEGVSATAVRAEEKVEAGGTRRKWRLEERGEVELWRNEEEV